jgi:clumping factor A
VTYAEEPVTPAAAQTEEFDFGLGDETPWQTRATSEAEVAAATAPDYDRASSAIHAARSEQPDENAWRRDTPAAAGGERTDQDAWRRDTQAAAGGEQADQDDGRPDTQAAAGGEQADQDAWRPDTQAAAGGEQADENAWRRDTHAEAHAGLNDEFDEPDADDPDDEPLPQSVQPSDAVRIARMDAEVLVVDGRPRYHLADCPHLVGRLTEPIGVNEAVELGFSPCGLCRPIDRLVAAAARH